MSRGRSSEKKISTLADLTHDPRNARKHGERNLDTIGYSLKEYGAARSIVVDEHGVILAGNGLVEAAGKMGMIRVKTVEADGNEIVAVVRRGLTKEQKIGLAVADNRTSELAEWDIDVLVGLGADVDLSGLFSADELAELMANQAAAGVDLAPAGSLAEKFGVPPFSVLDARQGYWQERKRAWLALGIESELGRGEVLTYTESEEIIGDGLHHFRREKKRMAGTPPHPPTVRRNADGSLNYNGTAGQSKRFNAQRQGRHIARKVDPSPGGSPRPAANYKNRQRGTGSGKAIKK